jgi:hypothetical protein
VRGVAFRIALIAVLAVLSPLAHASPPDPTWIAGLWDDGDHDDAVVLVVSANAFLAPVLLVDAHTARMVRRANDLVRPAVHVRPDPGPRHGRAPPLARAARCQAESIGESIGHARDTHTR